MIPLDLKVKPMGGKTVFEKSVKLDKRQLAMLKYHSIHIPY